MIQVKTTKGRFPLILLVSILFVTLALLLGLLWQVWFAYKYSRRIQTHNLQIQRLTGTIIYLDEVLTMSARMGATTGEQKWEERYLIYEHQLDTDINEAKRLISDAFLIESAAQTDNANIKLVAMEKRAFDLIREGKKDAAITLLFSETYEVQKKIYADGMEQITAEMQMSGKRFLDGYYYRISLAVIAVAIILPCLMIAWVYVLRAMNMNIRARKLVEEKIMLLNESLEQRVSKRTADLAKTNEKLELEIIKRTKTEEKLKDSFEQTRVWLDNSPVCTKVVDLDFNLQYMSAAGIKALKIDDVTTLYGKPYPFDFFPESTKKVMQKTLKKVKETGETITGEAPVCDI
ncbi:MAG: PAS domain-containing protein, partial [Planctomycetes bacterium]|nr:PAS domain-containing protein [Planctomycetota bacterium]